MISNAKKIIKEYSNQSKIIENASQYIVEDSYPENMDDDWVSLFMDKARLVSSEDFQLIWGKIMAIESNEPNSIPKGVLHILSQMDQDDAKTFTILCAMTVESDIECAPIINKLKQEDYKRYGINFDKLLNLSALGLIEFNFDSFGTSYAIEAAKVPYTIRYFDEQYVFTNDTPYIHVGGALYTKAGQALYKAIEVKKIDGFWEEFCLPLWKENQEDKV